MSTVSTQRFDGRALTAHGSQLAEAIERGIDAITPERWAELTAQGEDSGEWGAPEFADAVAVSEGLCWDFEGWTATLENLLRGPAKLGGVSLVVDQAAKQLAMKRSRS